MRLASSFGGSGKMSVSEILTIGDSSNARLFIPYRLDFHFIPSTHFPPLLPLCDISSASTEGFTPEGGSVYGFLSSQLRNLSQKEKARAVRFSGLEVFSEKCL